MYSIWKYQIPIQDETVLNIPVDFEFLSFQNQMGRLVIWCLVIPDNPKKEYKFKICGTGQNIKKYPGKYLGTAQMQSGFIAWHLFLDTK